MDMSPDAILERILKGRGISDVEGFLYPDYERHSHDPMLLPDIKPAIKRLQKAKELGEQVVIYGDYDIDGLCASALLRDAFSSMGLTTEIFIPDRFKEGYGLNGPALKKLAEGGATLVVTVDCGSTSIKEINGAKAHGLDVIVTDHHELGPELPPAVAVINPKRSDSRYPFTELAGNGVAFKLVQALQQHVEGLPNGQEKWLLDLVAFGTVCDVVPLLDENRMLVSKGLQVIAKTQRPGLRALAQVTGVPLSQINTHTFGYIFGPRLNAAGRLVHARKALQLLITQSPQEALGLAQELNAMNQERKQEQGKIERAAIEQAEQYLDDPLLVLHAKDWSHGIVGIVAARLLERYAKPVFIMQEMENGVAKGSARSFGDFSAAEGLNAVRPLLISGGGHKAAAGFSLPIERVPAFREQLISFYEQQNFNDQLQWLTPVHDVSVTTLVGVDLDLWQKLQLLQPFGHKNPEPLFRLESAQIADWRRVGADKSHLKAVIQDSTQARIDAIAFGYRNEVPEGDVQITARLDRNEFNGRVSAQLVIENIHPA